MDWYWWAFFLFIVVVLLGMDLGLFQREAHEVKFKEAIESTTLRVALALLFCLGIYLGWIGGYETKALGAQAGLEFLTGYLVEIALSIDNVFVFALVFQYFRVPPAYQHRILFWGILGALVMRGILIFAGIALMERFHWIIYVFGLILIYGGIKMIRDTNKPTPRRISSLKLFLVCAGRLSFTARDFSSLRERAPRQRRVVLVAIETTDLILAVDSIPAVRGHAGSVYRLYFKRLRHTRLESDVLCTGRDSKALSISALWFVGHSRLYRGENAPFANSLCY
jgi:tellurite resistance protein TerC